jgi:hypothetical protein
MNQCQFGVERKPVVHPGDGLTFSPYDVMHSPDCPTCEQALRDEWGWQADHVMRLLAAIREGVERRLRADTPGEY